jgi:acetyltransferase-like isoleucine patch superfamily enzyme
VGNIIKKGLLRVLYSIIIKIGNGVNIINSIYNFQKIKRNKSIFLGRNVKIHPSAKIEIIEGGKVYIGENSEILAGVIIITYGGNVEIGNNCIINPYVIIYGLGGAKIGDDVLIAGHTMIVPDNHCFKDLDIPIRLQGSKRKGIIINNNVWIGHGCTILDGVEIGSGSIIAAGSVVNRDILSNIIAGGVPAKVIKERK